LELFRIARRQALAVDKRAEAIIAVFCPNTAVIGNVDPTPLVGSRQRMAG
jgi:uroporphyrinogen-III decarboxylase